MQGFYFEPPSNPHEPKDPTDPPPQGWDTNLDTSDFRKALFGYPPPLFVECAEWEKRELERHGFKLVTVPGRLILKRVPIDQSI